MSDFLKLLKNNSFSFSYTPSNNEGQITDGNTPSSQSGGSFVDKINGMISRIKLPTVETDNTVKADKSIFIFGALILAGLYLILRGGKK